MSKEYLLEIATPEKMVWSGYVNFTVLPSAKGEIGILFSHAPMLAMLKAGEIAFERSDGQKYLATSGGFFEVKSNKVTVLAETAEFSQEIDKERASRSKQFAEIEIRKLKDKIINAHEVEVTEEKRKFDMLSAALERAMVRLKVAEKQDESKESKSL